MGLLKILGRKAKSGDVEVDATDFSSMQFESKEILTKPGEEPKSEDKKPRAEEAIFREQVERLEALPDEVHEIGAMQADMTRMLSALRDSVRLNQDTVSGIEKISRFVQTAQENAVALERLRPENAVLKTKLENVRAELSRGDLRTHELESRIAAYKARMAENYTELDATRARLIEVEESFTLERAKREESVAMIDKLKSQRRELLTNVEALQTERENLQEDFQSVHNSEAGQNQRITQLLKRAEHLSAQIDDERRAREAAISKLKSLKLDYADLNATQADTMSKLDLSRHEVSSYHKVLIDYRKRNEDKIFALKSALANQQTERKVSEDMVRYGDEEQAKLKRETNAARRKTRELEKLVKQNMIDLKENRDALSKANVTNEELNEKFLAVLVEMDSLRRTSRIQSQKLEEYASVKGVAVGQGFYDDRQKLDARTPIPEEEKGTTFRGDGDLINLKLVTEPLKKA